MSNKHLPRLFVQALNEKRVNLFESFFTLSSGITTLRCSRDRPASKRSFDTTSTHFPIPKL